MSGYVSTNYVTPAAALKALLPEQGFVWPSTFGAAACIVEQLNHTIPTTINKNEMTQAIRKMFKTATIVVHEKGAVSSAAIWDQVNRRLDWDDHVETSTLQSFAALVIGARDQYDSNPPAGTVEVYEQGSAVPKSCFYGGLQVSEFSTEFNKQERLRQRKLPSNATWRRQCGAGDVSDNDEE
ncbi:hypothetical protein M426DRAFT_94791 [Hypoxylon sp. CI-4A]|nr:hypothetical protein M426DRAFT_94791 [Hypoxylon sp. CI-4A]